MSLRLYDTASRTVRDFRPRVEGIASLYLCGATVQDTPHLGHVRGSVVFDVLRRWLTYTGHRVVYVRNVTDIEDRLLDRATGLGIPEWELAARNERAFAAAYSALGCDPPTIEPRATGHITEIHGFVQRLIDAGHAYAADGDVYFSVGSWPSYGALSGQRPADMQASEDVDRGGRKRDPRDFALWKSTADGPSWPSPWGAGRPGWHIECSAMSERYLGPAFDIHGAGIDLVFPHNENELAQSRAVGDGSAAFWLHNGWVVDAAGEKMSKSVGNDLKVDSVLETARPVDVRYYLVAPHYRSTIRGSLGGIAEAATAYSRLEGFVQRAGDLIGDVDPRAAMLCADFVAAMDDDLGTPKALAAIHDTVREANKSLADGDKRAVRGALGSVRAMLGVLGLDPLDPRWSTATGDADLTATVDALVSLALEQRQSARVRRDFGAADAIRDELAAAGIAVEDTPGGPRWTAPPGTVISRAAAPKPAAQEAGNH